MINTSYHRWQPSRVVDTEKNPKQSSSTAITAPGTQQTITTHSVFQAQFPIQCKAWRHAWTYALWQQFSACHLVVDTQLVLHAAGCRPPGWRQTALLTINGMTLALTSAHNLAADSRTYRITPMIPLNTGQMELGTGSCTGSCGRQPLVEAVVLQPFSGTAVLPFQWPHMPEIDAPLIHHTSRTVICDRGWGPGMYRYLLILPPAPSLHAVACCLTENSS